MSEGTIKWFNAQRGYGFIKREGQDDLFIHIKQWHGAPGSVPQEGDRVTFNESIGPKGRPEAQNVRLAGAEMEEPTLPRVSVQDAYRFLNPYNFVRYLEKPRPQRHVLGDCPPSPHDRYIGLTGRIICELKAETPLFISDSHAVRGEVGQHRSFRFFQVENEDGKLEPALPATSLRGMLRAVFEAVTNSCFAVFDHSQRLEFRERPEYGNKVKSGAGIVNALPEPAKNDQSAKDGEIVLCYVAKVGAYYEGREQWKNVLGQKPNGQPWQCGDRAVARVKRLRQGYVVRELSTSKKRLQPLSDGEEYVEGWLKITGKGEGTSKRGELLFLNPNRHGSTGVVRFGFDEMEEYNLVLAGQLDRGDLPAPPQSSQLALGDLVWVETRGKEKHSRVRRIVRVQVPRTPYKHTIGELLLNNLHPCDDYNILCPTCRIFGWVHEDAAKLDKKKRVAHAGQVRLSHGRLTQNADTLPDIPLAILSTPKPTTTQFYLLGPDGRPSTEATYDDDSARLRGRKFYRHHGKADPKEYERAESDSQNRTVCGALKPGATFTFTLEFENLAPLELGALLYALELEDGMFHRLGYAKPLGFGSVKVTIDSVEKVNWKIRFQSLAEGAGWQTVDKSRVEKLKSDFIQAMQDLYGSEFNDLLADLRTLLRAPPDLPIHYPRPTEKFDSDHPQYEWFMGNKRRVEKRGRGDLPPPETLALASDDMTGLPLISKDGEEEQS